MRILYLPNKYSQQRQREKPSHIYPVLMAMQAQYYRNLGHEVTWGLPFDTKGKTWSRGGFDICDTQGGTTLYWKEEPFDKIIEEPENIPFLSLPHPDRVFTRAKSYTSGNYKYLPGTHMQVANGCWWGKCSFCVENQGRSNKPSVKSTESGGQRERNGQEPPAPANYLVRPVEDCIEEIKEIKALNYREVFDDSGTFPTGEWLDKFLEEMGRINILPNRYIRFGCNHRLVVSDFDRMFRVGWRMLLFGIESANQQTLDKINKGVKVEDIIPTIRKASMAGLEPHIAVMFGYPWEDDEAATSTLRLTHYLLRKGYAKTAQASFYTPPDNRLGQGRQNLSHRHYTKRIYSIAYSPQFWFNQLKDIKDIDDIKYLWRKIRAGLWTPQS